MLRAACLGLAVLLAACDTTGVDSVPLDDTLIMAVEEGAVLRLVTEGTPGCFVPIVADARTAGETVRVEVEGLERVTGPTCLALTPSIWTTRLPPTSERLRVEIRHRGETDAYVVEATRGGFVLVPVRTSTTRPAE